VVGDCISLNLVLLHIPASIWPMKATLPARLAMTVTRLAGTQSTAFIKETLKTKLESKTLSLLQTI